MHSRGPLGEPTNAHHKKMSQCLYGYHSWGPQCQMTRQERLSLLFVTPLPACSNPGARAAVIREGEQRKPSENPNHSLFL